MQQPNGHDGSVNAAASDSQAERPGDSGRTSRAGWLWALLTDPDSPLSLPGRWVLALFLFGCGIFWIGASFNLALSVIPGLWNQAAKASGAPRLPGWVSFLLLAALLWVGWRIFRLADRLIEPYMPEGSKPVPLGRPPDDDPVRVQERSVRVQREARRMRQGETRGAKGS